MREPNGLVPLEYVFPGLYRHHFRPFEHGLALARRQKVDDFVPDHGIDEASPPVVDGATSESARGSKAWSHV
jgi:hypothetical protein